MTRVFGALTLALILLVPTAAAAAPEPAAFVAVERGRLHIETCGVGPHTLVLIHDAILDSASWDGVWPLLCARYLVIRYDRRGYGRSPEAQGPYSAVEDLAAVMRAAGAEHAALVASSAGGGLALDFALAHPGAVDALVLAGPQASGQGASIPFELQFLGPLLDLKRGETDRAIDAASRLAFVVVPGHEAARRRFVEILNASPQDLTRADPERPRPSALPRLHTITAPALILLGDHDAADNRAHALEIARRLPGARLQVMPDSGHMMYLEHPDAFADQVSDWVGGRKAKAAKPDAPAGARA